MSETKETKLSLPKKENDLFRSVITCYEQKQYGKGLKIADSVLKKFPNHGETLSMKGLILNCQGEKKKAFELMKAGVAADSRSHVVWHVFGLYHKGDGNFLEAVKCYESALLIDVNNQNILKDLSWLQVQIGDIPGFVESRRTILRFKPTLRGSYVTLAAALYLSGEFQESFDVVEQYRLSCSDKGDPYEEGELHLFQSKCLEALCLYAEALAHLIKVKDFIVDKLSLNVKSAELSLLSGDFESAKKMWLALVASQPENYRLHCGMQAAYLELDPPTSKSMLLLTRLELPSTRMALSAPQRAMLRELYARFGTRGASGKIQLTLFKGEELRAPLDAHLKANLRAAVPSLFHDVCSLVRVPGPLNLGFDQIGPEKPEEPEEPGNVNLGIGMVYVTDARDARAHPVVSMVLGMVSAYITNLSKGGSFDANDATSAPQPPTALLWAYYLQAHLQELCGDLPQALQSIDTAILHTPTAIDMYGKRARLLKKMGDAVGAAVAMDECRALDLQDRYLNNKATKYLLRADAVTLAQNTIAMFTKHDLEGDPQKTLYELQVSWFEIEAGNAYARSKQWGPALRKYYAVKKHFADYTDDMLDFHGYCIRKTTLRAYMDLLAMLQASHTHKTYQRALRGALKIFLHLHECPEDAEGLGHLPPAERKKERLRLKKAKAKKEEERVVVAGGAEKESGEPQEDELLARDFLAEAGVWMAPVGGKVRLLEPATVALMVDVYVRTWELLGAAEALTASMQVHPGHPELVYALVRLAHKLRHPGKKTLGPRGAEIRSLVNALLGSEGLQCDAYLERYATRAGGCFESVLCLAKSRYFLDKSLAGLEALLTPSLLQASSVSAAGVVELVRFIETNVPTEAQAQLAPLLEAMRKRFPSAGAFHPDLTVASAMAVSAAAKEEQPKDDLVVV